MPQPILQVRESGRRARAEFLRQHPLLSGNKAIDYVLDGGFETGNFYLFLGGAKSGKSTILRALGLKIAESYPVLYVNFEQLGRSVFLKLYASRFGRRFREDILNEPEATDSRIEGLPDLPCYIFWTDGLLNKSFNSGVKDALQQAVDEVAEKDPEHRKPVVVLENLSDIYNERLNGQDNLTNMVTQTALDIKAFAMANDIAILLAQHTTKMDGSEPTLDDVRDSKRVVDLAHSIFATYTVVDGGGVHRKFKYISGRGISDTVRWDVVLDGWEVKFVETLPEMEVNSQGKARFKKGFSL